MWWYKIPVLLIVATANHISLSDQTITKLRSRSLFATYLLPAFEVCPSDPSVCGLGSSRRRTLKGCFWALTACEVVLIWSVNHLRSSVAHRILVVLVHPLANFPPNPRITLPFYIGLPMSILSLAVHLAFNSHQQRIRQSSASPDLVSSIRPRIPLTIACSACSVIVVCASPRRFAALQICQQFPCPRHTCHSSQEVLAPAGHGIDASGPLPHPRVVALV